MDGGKLIRGQVDQAGLEVALTALYLAPEICKESF
jgi:hypothetical protein